MGDTWHFNEWYVEWACWAFGVTNRYRGGWDYDMRTICVGPLRLVWLR